MDHRGHGLYSLVAAPFKAHVSIHISFLNIIIIFLVNNFIPNTEIFFIYSDNMSHAVYIKFKDNEINGKFY